MFEDAHGNDVLEMIGLPAQQIVKAVMEAITWRHQVVVDAADVLIEDSKPEWLLDRVSSDGGTVWRHPTGKIKVRVTADGILRTL